MARDRSTKTHQVIPLPTASDVEPPKPIAVVTPEQAAGVLELIAQRNALHAQIAGIITVGFGLPQGDYRIEADGRIFVIPHGQEAIRG